MMISLHPQGRSFSCREGQSVLDAMTRAGCQDIRVGCRGGGCGICRVRVRAGEFNTGVMSYAQVDQGEREQGYALACRLFPQSDLEIQVAARFITQTQRDTP